MSITTGSVDLRPFYQINSETSEFTKKNLKNLPYAPEMVHDENLTSFEPFYIYNPSYLLLFSRPKNTILKKEGTKEISLEDFWFCYKVGYLKGCATFDQEYKVPVEVLYGKKSEAYTKKIEYLYFDQKIGPMNRLGCSYVKHSGFKVASPQIMEMEGFNAAFTKKIDDLVKNEPELFNHFRKRLEKETNGNKTTSINTINNDFLSSTIDEYIEEFKIMLKEDNYSLLCASLKYYFENGIFPKHSKWITFIKNPNKKKLGWALKNLYHAVKEDREFLPKTLPFSYLEFAKKNLYPFKDDLLDRDNLTKSTLYTYFHTKL